MSARLLSFSLRHLKLVIRSSFKNQSIGTPYLLDMYLCSWEKIPLTYEKEYCKNTILTLRLTLEKLLSIKLVIPP